MWTTKEREQICVNAIKAKKSFDKILCYTYGKLKKNEYVNKNGKNSLDKSSCVCVINSYLLVSVEVVESPRHDAGGKTGLDFTIFSLYTTLTTSSCGHWQNYFGRYGR